MISNPLISLIVATLGNRPDKLICLLDSLEKQEENNFEVIIVDQSESGLSGILSCHSKVIYIHSERKGLSYNRNIGINYAKGEILAFPDDDCIAPLDYVTQINKGISKLIGEYLYAFGNVLQIENGKPFHPLYKIGHIRHVNSFNCIFISSAAMVFHRSVFNIVGLFDEEFGVGAKYGAAEEVDIMLRLLDKGVKGINFPDLNIYHPITPPIEESIVRHNSYSYSIGALARKHWQLSHNWKFMIVFGYSLLRSTGGVLVAGLRRDSSAIIHIAKFKAKWDGFKAYGQELKERKQMV